KGLPIRGPNPTAVKTPSGEAKTPLSQILEPTLKSTTPLSQQVSRKAQSPRGGSPGTEFGGWSNGYYEDRRASRRHHRFGRGRRRRCRNPGEGWSHLQPDAAQRQQSHRQQN